MDMGFVLYLATYRLALIAVAFSVLLDYKLFAKGDGSGARGAQMDATVGKTRFTLKNAAPGTCFAAFAAMIIVVMLANQPPEVKIETNPVNGTQTVVLLGQNQMDVPPVAEFRRL